ncbi:hypothetical protein GT037_010542 [Alternaria burnsii]|uniref:Uncharacterized protein n=1 Tax=Alternaria burnsii TaxID=1187904 RepID=A0A8H7ATU5_9PLEO|nr:uncharacterized protein GT037_010542 [Alternaria burnsii]KAF7671467.1 hypothetical protein GT037_010542 [Alternaria burnsii]
MFVHLHAEDCSAVLPCIPSTESKAVLRGIKGIPQSTQAEKYSALKAVWQSEWIEVCDCPDYGAGDSPVH